MRRARGQQALRAELRSASPPKTNRRSTRSPRTPSRRLPGRGCPSSSGWGQVQLWRRAGVHLPQPAGRLCSGAGQRRAAGNAQRDFAYATRSQAEMTGSACSGWRGPRIPLPRNRQWHSQIRFQAGNSCPPPRSASSSLKSKRLHQSQTF